MLVWSVASAMFFGYYRYGYYQSRLNFGRVMTTASITCKRQPHRNQAWELSIGWICACISAIFAGLLGWLAYLVVWRNPREYGVNDFFKVSTFVLFVVLVIIAVGFSVVAFRLITGKHRHRGLMSPMVLMIWGAFFAVMSVVILIDVIANRKWLEAPRHWEILSVSISMSSAAFALARKRQHVMADKNLISHQDHSAKTSQPFRPE